MSGMTPQEIQGRLRTEYLDRLIPRVRKMRRLFADRLWEELRAECSQIQLSASRFGFPDIGVLATDAVSALDHQDADQARRLVESLLVGLDHVLVTESLSKRH